MTSFLEPDLEACLSSLPAFQLVPKVQRGNRLDEKPSHLPAATRKAHWILLVFVPTTIFLITTTAFLCARVTVLGFKPSPLPQERPTQLRNTRWPASIISLIPCDGTIPVEENFEKAQASGEEPFQIYTTLDNIIEQDLCLRKTPAESSKNSNSFTNSLSITKDRIVPFKNAENKFTFGIRLRDRDANLRSKFSYTPPQYQANPSQPANMDLPRYLEFYSKRSAALGSLQTTAEHAIQASPHLHLLSKRHVSAGVWVGAGLGSFLVFIMVIMACCG